MATMTERKEKNIALPGAARLSQETEDRGQRSF